MICIVDYEMSNLRSVAKALEHLGYEAVISGDPEVLKKADRIILPGVGAFGDAMKNLKKKGLVKALNEEVIEKGKPFLGICLGAQLVAKKSFELGEHDGLGWINATVIPFKEERRIHIGWNSVNKTKESMLFQNIQNNTDFYFVHGFHIKCEEDVTCANAVYGKEFTAAIEKKNIFAVQFHPEKSQRAGLKLLENFIEWRPC